MKQQTMKVKRVMKKQTMKRDKQWLRNKDQRKNPKIYSAHFVQLRDGSFQMVGGGTQVLVKKNQHQASWRWVPVDTRDMACEMRMKGVKSL